MSLLVKPPGDEQPPNLDLEEDSERSGKKLNWNVIVRNVGQGNWNEVWLNSQLEFVHDIGASTKASHGECRRIIRTSGLRAQTPVLLISHWDIDHYHVLIAMEPNEIQQFRLAFVPSLLLSNTSKRALELLKKELRHRLHILPFAPGRRVKWKVSLVTACGGKGYRVFRGEHSSDTNKAGLALAVWGCDDTALLPGDHHYHQVFDDMMASLPDGKQIHMVTPHHGGRAGRMPDHLCKGYAGRAVTSVGQNSYGRPMGDVRFTLELLGFSWIDTMSNGTDMRLL